jgi:phosphoribosyl 1,2-cyclic phosphodiesterase
VLRFKSLGSGSTGNATLVEAAGLRPRRLLVDCGLGVRQLSLRLAEAGLADSDIDAVFVTHEHSDHIGCARQFSLRHRVPVWMSRGTFEGIGLPDFDGLLHIAHDGQAIDLGELQLMPFTVPHDAREPLQLSCTDGASKLGLLTDLGHATSHVLAHLAACHALLLECNHDIDLLEQSSYPPFLKRRVGGQYGHLSNVAAGDIARAVGHSGLSQIVAAHLSQQNNRPDLARQAMFEALGHATDIVVADASTGTRWLSI